LIFVSSLLFALSIVSMSLSTFLFLGYKTVKHGTPMLFNILSSISKSLAPFTRYLAKTTIIGPLFAFVIRCFFFFGFIVLLMSDQLIRTVFGLFIGLHPSKRKYCRYQLKSFEKN
jgi:hypothetical protein